MSVAVRVGTDAPTWKALLLTHAAGVVHAEPAGWKLVGFNDAAWDVTDEIALPAGAADVANAECIVRTGFTGSADRDLAHWITRREFTLTDDSIADGLITADVDDWLTIYLDGVSILTIHAGGWPTGAGDASNRNALHTASIPLAGLDAGDHCLAIEVWNKSSTFENPTWAQARLDATLPDPAADVVGWDVYAAAAPNGAILGTIQQADAPLNGATARKARIALNDVGSGGFEVNRYAAIATEANLAAGNIVKCRWPWRTGYDFAIVLEKPDPLILASADEKSGEKLTYKGRGILAYLDRAIMDAAAYTTGLDIVDVWTELWHTGAVKDPSGIAFDSTTPGYVYVCSGSTRRIYKINQSTRKATALSGALSTHWLGGLSFDPADATIAWVLVTPWIAGSSAHCQILKVRRSDWHVLATFDIGTNHWTDIKADATRLWLSNYTDSKIYEKSKATGATSASHTIAYGGVNQTQPQAVSVNGTNLGYWFANGNSKGSTRVLFATQAAPTVITDVVKTTGLASYGGEWTTESGSDYLYPVSYQYDQTWKYRITSATPHDPVDDKWRLDEATPGAILWRTIQEAQAVGRPQQPIPDIDYDFTATLDSAGDAWDTHDGTTEFDAAVGDSLLSTDLRLTAYGLVLGMDVAPDALTLVGRNLSSFGTDRTGVAFGAGVVRFEKGVNIIPELARKENERDLHSHMLARGKDSLYARATEADLGYVREGFVSTDLADATALQGTAEAELDAERIRAERITFKVPIGDRVTHGIYLPFTHYAVGDLVTLHTGSGEHDFTNETFRLYAISLEEGEAGDWPIATLELGSAFLAETPTTTSGGSGSAGTGGTSGGGSATIIQAQDVTVEGIDDTGTTTSSASGRKLRIQGASIVQEAAGIVRIILDTVGTLLGLGDVDAGGITQGQGLAYDEPSGTFQPVDLRPVPIIAALSSPPTQAELEAAVGPASSAPTFPVAVTSSTTGLTYGVVSSGGELLYFPLVAPETDLRTLATAVGCTNGYQSQHAAFAFDAAAGTAGHLCMIYLTAAGDIETDAFDVATGTLTGAVTLHAALNLDQHATPTIAVRPDGKRIAIYSSHNDAQLRKRISTAAHSSAAWAAEVDLDAALGGVATQYTYPQIAVIDDGLHLLYRRDPGGVDHADAKWAMAISTDFGDTWPAETVIGYQAGEGMYMAAIKTAANRIDYLATSDCSFCTAASDLYHFSRRDGVLYTDDDVEITAALPLAVASMTKVWEGGATGHATPFGHIVLAADGRPRIGFAEWEAIGPAPEDPRWLWGYLDDAGVWHVQEVAGGAVGSGELNCTLDPLDANVLWYSKLVGGVAELFRWHTPDLGVTGYEQQITFDSAFDQGLVNPVADAIAAYRVVFQTGVAWDRDLPVDADLVAIGYAPAVGSEVQRLVILDGDDLGLDPLAEAIFRRGSDGTWYASRDLGTTWEAVSGAGASNLDDLADVNAPTPAQYDQLVFDGTEWINGGWHREVTMADYGSGLEPVTDSAGDWLYGRFAGPS